METVVDLVDTSLWEFKGKSEYVDKKFLMSTPFPVFFILTTYLWFVLKFGPELMKNRKPFKLDRVLPIYNLIQVVASFYILSKGLAILPIREAINITWNKCYSEINYMPFIDGAHCYLLSKFVELLDTVFFVLRKKQRQVSFLHVYHHTIMAFGAWCVVKYSVNDSVLFIGITNSVVHILMYSYYGLSVYPTLTKYLWWKKYITIVQLVQFCLMFLNITIGHFVSECPKSYVLVIGLSFNTVYFFYLFRNFYFDAYKNGRNANNGAVKETEVTLNGNKKNSLNYIIKHRKLASNIN